MPLKVKGEKIIKIKRIDVFVYQMNILCICSCIQTSGNRMSCKCISKIHNYKCFSKLLDSFARRYIGATRLSVLYSLGIFFFLIKCVKLFCFNVFHSSSLNRTVLPSLLLTSHRLSKRKFESMGFRVKLPRFQYWFCPHQVV